jgi:hypothetical protein
LIGGPLGILRDLDIDVLFHRQCVAKSDAWIRVDGCGDDKANATDAGAGAADEAWLGIAIDRSSRLHMHANDMKGVLYRLILHAVSHSTQCPI